jgi:hypothetical protein
MLQILNSQAKISNQSSKTFIFDLEEKENSKVLALIYSIFNQIFSLLRDPIVFDGNLVTN